AQAEVADDLHALDRVHVRVQVAHAHVVLGQVFGEVLGHALGQGVTSTRSPIATRALISPSTSSTWVATGRISTGGSTSPVGRTTSSVTSPSDSRSSYGPGVADTKIARGERASHSSNLSGRLSSADGSRKPNSTSVSLRERSPLYMAPICGTVTCDSSTTSSASGGR